MLELNNRRENVFKHMKENSVAIIFSGVSKISSEDEFLPFCVNKNFYYLTNIEQEHSVLMLVNGIGEKRTYLFVDEYNELKEKWTGKRLTFEAAGRISNITSVYSMNNFENMLSLAISNKNNQYGNIKNLYIDLSPEIKIGDELSSKMFADQIKENHKQIDIIDIYPIIRDLRIIKSSYEVDCILKAIELTNGGLAHLISSIKPEMKEYELADEFEFYGRKNQRAKLAFDTIVASGKNATCLHYPSQNDNVNRNDLVLFDLGYRHEQYCADISRTYPVNGVFGGVQKGIYQAVLNCNKAVIEYIKAGMTIKDLQDFTINFLQKECVRLNLIQENEDIKKYYYHNVSHHLGLDTHDVSLREKPLENGNVITVEPGLYFEKYGVGVRIEDDVLIMNGRAEVLSKNIAKEISDIEKLFKTRR